MAIPGIGLLSAMTLVSEIGDISRFPTGAKAFCLDGHITKAGPRSVRHVLGEAAHVACRHEPYASDFAATKRRRGTGIALVRISWKLLVEVFHVLSPLSRPERGSCECGQSDRASP